MPPAGRSPLAAAEIGSLNQWVENGTPENAAACATPPEADCTERNSGTARPARRLTNRELENSVYDVFGVQLQRDLPQVLALLPVDRTNRKEFDTQLARAMSSQDVEAYQAIGEAVAAYLTASDSRLSALQACLTQPNPSLGGCIVPFIQRIGRRAYRRILTTSEVNELRDLYSTNLVYSRNDALATIFSALIQSPHFSTLLEINGTPLQSDANVVELTGYEVASRLSYALWGAPPDESLLIAAEKNELSDLEKVREHGRRLMQAPAASAHARHYFKQVLGTYVSPGMQQSADFFDGLDATALPAAAEGELDAFLDYLFEQNAPMKDFFLSRKARIPTSGPGVAALKAVYGISSGGLVDLPPERLGMLSRVGFLLYSTNDVHPILRGLSARRIFLCQEFPPPPPGLPIPPIPQDPSKDTNTRALEHTGGASCIGCHSYINPMGYLLASFDSIGRFRTSERLFDQAGVFTREVSFSTRYRPNLESLEEPELNGHVELAQLLSGHGLVNRCFVKHRLRFFEGTAEPGGPSCVEKEMERRFKAGGIQDMTLGLIAPEFMLRRIAPAGGAP